MRTTGLSLAVAVAVAGGCASFRPSADPLRVELAPGERYDTSFVAPAGEAVAVRLTNLGPGAADFVIRLTNGVVMQSGPLDSVEVKFTPPTPVTLLVALEAHAGAGTSVVCSATDPDGHGLAWATSPAPDPRRRASPAR